MIIIIDNNVIYNKKDIKENKEKKINKKRSIFLK